MKFKFLPVICLLFAGIANATCLPSGVTDQYIYFVAVDGTDFTTRETGLSSFTVYRSRDGGVSTAMITPTINETSAANMPGVYELLLDEDTSIGAGNDVEEMVYHITHAGMAPVTRSIEICRPKLSVGETLNVASGIGEAQVKSMDANTITSTVMANDSIGSSEVADNAIGATEVADGAIDAAALAADVNADIWTASCEDQGGGYTCAEAVSLLLAEAMGTCTYTSGTRTWQCSDPSGTEVRFTVVYDAALDGGRTTSTPVPFTP